MHVPAKKKFLYDLLVILGAPVKYLEGEYSLPLPTMMRAEAGKIALRRELAQHLVISGGYHMGAKYLEENLLPYVSKPTLEASANARHEYESEAQAMADYIANNYPEAKPRMTLEETAKDSYEAAEILKIMLRRAEFEGVERIGVLTLLHHMPKVRVAFGKADVPMTPVFAEDILGWNSEAWTNTIYEYYQTPKSDKYWNALKIRHLLREKSSVADLLD